MLVSQSYRKKIIRIPSCNKYNAHTESICKELKLLKLEDHATHMQHNIHQPKTNNVYAKYSVHFDVPSVINSSPKTILDKIYTHSLQGITKYIKDYILQSYQEICTVVNCYICDVPV